MSVLAETPWYLVEYDQWAGHRMLSIIDKFTGLAKVIEGPSIAGDFRACLKTHPVDRVVRTWLNIARNCTWQPAYKPMTLVFRELRDQR